MEDILSCRLCSNKYTISNKPRCLECGHTFCQSCLFELFWNKTYKQPDTQLKCPFCYQTLNIESLNDICVNFSILSEIPQYPDSQIPSNKDIWSQYQKLDFLYQKIEAYKVQIQNQYQESEKMNKDAYQTIQLQFQKIQERISCIKNNFLSDIKHTRQQNTSKLQKTLKIIQNQQQKINEQVKIVQQYIDGSLPYKQPNKLLINLQHFQSPPKPDYKICAHRHQKNLDCVDLVKLIQQIGHLSIIPISVHKSGIFQQKPKFKQWKASPPQAQRGWRRNQSSNPSMQRSLSPASLANLQLNIKHYYYVFNGEKRFLNGTFSAQIQKQKIAQIQKFDLLAATGHKAFSVNLSTMKISKINMHGNPFPPVDLLRQS